MDLLKNMQCIYDYIQSTNMKSSAITKIYYLWKRNNTVANQISIS